MEGELLRDFCDRVGLRQLVREPTRDGNLLDLALTDLDEVRCKVVAKVADHSGLALALPITVPRVEIQCRLVWHFRDADWDGLNNAMLAQDWAWLSTVSANVGAEQLTSLILDLAEQFIPRRHIYERKSTHPWINDRVLKVVREKHAAQGTAMEESCRKFCSDCIMEEYGKYVARERHNLQKLPAGAKAWWSRSKRLMQKKGVVSSIPALRDADNEWVLQPVAKADLLADTFALKHFLPDVVVNEYTELPNTQSRGQRVLKTLCEKDARDILHKLRIDSATGPDLLPARILKLCASALALPILLLAQCILRSGEWPQLWRQHWVAPLHKKKSVYQPQNYRGIHLTAQLSKVIERLLKMLYGPYLRDVSAFGPNQFAYTVGRGARDALALLMMTWLQALATGRKVAVYCSDVSGAFDRVPLKRLAAKLKQKGLHPQIVTVLVSWLQRRRAQIVVAGGSSKEMTLMNMVFQGTVTGPDLWNLFFEDARQPIIECFSQKSYSLMT